MPSTHVLVNPVQEYLAADSSFLRENFNPEHGDRLFHLIQIFNYHVHERGFLGFTEISEENSAPALEFFDRILSAICQICAIEEIANNIKRNIDVLFNGEYGDQNELRKPFNSHCKNIAHAEPINRYLYYIELILRQYYIEVENQRTKKSSPEVAQLIKRKELEIQRLFNSNNELIKKAKEDAKAIVAQQNTATLKQQKHAEREVAPKLKRMAEKTYTKIMKLLSNLLVTSLIGPYSEIDAFDIQTMATNNQKNPLNVRDHPVAKHAYDFLSSIIMASNDYTKQPKKYLNKLYRETIQFIIANWADAHTGNINNRHLLLKLTNAFVMDPGQETDLMSELLDKNHKIIYQATRFMLDRYFALKSEASSPPKFLSKFIFWKKPDYNHELTLFEDRLQTLFANHPQPDLLADTDRLSFASQEAIAICQTTIEHFRSLS